MSNNLKTWNDVKQVPPEHLKEIKFGYLKGKSDINPQWRLMAMTQAFGMVGHGWTYRIVRTWSEKTPDGQVLAFAEVAVKTKFEGEWGEEFSGIGGSMIAELAKGNLKSNDEGYKMAVTDALSVAFKCVGIAADIYLGNYDGSKYAKTSETAYTDQEAIAKKLEAEFNQTKLDIENAQDASVLGKAYNYFKNTVYANQVIELCKAKKAKEEWK